MSLLGLIIAFEGFGTLAWLLGNPSEPESRVFLSYSLEKWGLILITSLLVFLAVYLPWVLRNSREWILAFKEYFEHDEQAVNLFGFVTIVFVITLVGKIALLSTIRAQSYIQQLLPVIAFITLTIVQVWIFLLVSLLQARIRVWGFWFPINPTDQIPLEKTDTRVITGLIIVSMFYLFAQGNAGIKVPGVVELGDTTSYLEGSMLPLNDPAFYSERRPWGILLIYKVFGGSLPAIGFAQLAVSTIVWLFLAWMLVGSMKTSAGKILGFLFILGTSLSPTVQIWNHAGLSESFSISLMILILALFIGILQRWRLLFFLALILCFALWVSVHEVNLYLGLLVAITLFVIGLMRRNYRIFLILSSCIAVILGINSHFSSLYALPRWALPVAEVITKRILPVPEYVDYFSSQGMPVTPELLALSGRWAHSDNYAILNNPGFREFSKWLFKDGKAVYTKFLIAHPIYTFTLPIVNLDEMLAADFSHLIPGYQPALPGFVNEFFFPIRWFWIFIWISALVVGYFLWSGLREKTRVFWLLIMFFVFSIPYLYLAWHGDALDLARHASIASIQFHLGVWMLFAYFLDKNVFLLYRAQGTARG